MWLAPPVRARGTPRVQFGLSRPTANSISASVGTGSARLKFSLLLLIGFPDSPTLECAPHDLSLGRSSYRKQAVSNCSGLSGQRIFSAIIQSAYSVAVEPFLVHLQEGSQERVSWNLLNRVADCFRCRGKSNIRHGCHHLRPLSSGEQLRGGAVVEISHFALQLICHAPTGMPAAKAGCWLGSDRTRFIQKRGCAYIRRHQLDLVMVSNDGALRHRRPRRFLYGGAGGLPQEKGP